MPTKAECIEFLDTPFMRIIILIRMNLAFWMKDEVIVAPFCRAIVFIGFVTFFNVFSFLSILLQQFLIFFLAIAKKIISVSPMVLPIRIGRLVNVIDVLHVKSYFC